MSTFTYVRRPTPQPPRLWDAPRFRRRDARPGGRARPASVAAGAPAAAGVRRGRHALRDRPVAGDHLLGDPTGRRVRLPRQPARPGHLHGRVAALPSLPSRGGSRGEAVGFRRAATLPSVTAL